MKMIDHIPVFSTKPDGTGELFDGVKESFMSLITPPVLEKPSDILKVRQAHRQNLLSAIPFIGEFVYAMGFVYENIDF